MMWKHPTPQEQALAQVDGFLSVPLNRLAMKWKVARYGLTERHWALRHLRIWAAIYRIREASSVPSGNEEHLATPINPKQ